MKQKRFDEFNQSFLVSASQVAYLEDASGTQAMLRKFCDIFRYFTKTEKHALLSKELEVMKSYIDIQKTSYANKFEFAFTDYGSYADMTVDHFVLVGFFDTIFCQSLYKYDQPVFFQIGIISGHPPKLRITVQSNSVTEIFEIGIREEGHA